MERLSPMDVSFLDQEKRGSHMHIGAVMIFEGPPPAYEDFRDHIESRLHLVPRYRQKLAYPRFEMGRPLWVDEPGFNIGYHVRHTALPAPGSVEQLRNLVGRIFSQRLDRSKPLWELWLRFELTDLKSIKNSLGGTVNDAFLTIVSGALGRWLRRHGVRTDGLELRGIVPVSIRADEKRGALGNQITAMLGPLPVYATDPIERMRIVTEAMKGLKQSKQAVGAETLTRLQGFAPPSVLAPASRLNFSTRAY